jgi:hypothetical protein
MAEYSRRAARTRGGRVAATREDPPLPDLSPDEKRSLIAFGTIVGLPLVIWLLVAVDRHLLARGYAQFVNVVIAAAALSTAMFTALYVMFTVRLWQNAAEQLEASRRTTEAATMQSLMKEYDDLREEIRYVQHWYHEMPDLHQAFHSYVLDRQNDSTEGAFKRLDDAGYRISRFFVRLSKLATQGYVSRRVIRAALGREHVAFFVTKIAPLDAIIRGVRGSLKSESDPDERFYGAFLKSYSVRDLQPDSCREDIE